MGLSMCLDKRGWVSQSRQLEQLGVEVLATKCVDGRWYLTHVATWFERRQPSSATYVGSLAVDLRSKTDPPRQQASCKGTLYSDHYTHRLRDQR